jgi:release factor glutamine methyltransferase
MRRLIKRVISFFLVPFVRWYLRKKRTHSYRGARVIVWPGVFHPGFFSSTHFLIDHLATQDLRRQALLELGCGTGLISVWSARRGAIVTAADLSSHAVDNTIANVKSAALPIRVFHSDMFDALGREVYDWIVINPPYYSRAVTSEADLAWNCGENQEYFRKLFQSLAQHVHGKSQVVMVLTREGCDLAGIFRLAEEHSFYLEMIKERRALLDGRDYLFRIRRLLTGTATIPA